MNLCNKTSLLLTVLILGSGCGRKDARETATGQPAMLETSAANVSVCGTWLSSDFESPMLEFRSTTELMLEIRNTEEGDVFFGRTSDDYAVKLMGGKGRGFSAIPDTEPGSARLLPDGTLLMTFGAGSVLELHGMLTPEKLVVSRDDGRFNATFIRKADS